MQQDLKKLEVNLILNKKNNNHQYYFGNLLNYLYSLVEKIYFDLFYFKLNQLPFI